MAASFSLFILFILLIHYSCQSLSRMVPLYEMASTRRLAPLAPRWVWRGLSGKSRLARLVEKEKELSARSEQRLEQSRDSL